MAAVTVVPSLPDNPSGLTRTQGTKVLVDGQELNGVIRVVLVAEVDDVWRAHIECFAQVQTMPGMWLDLQTQPRMAWWRRLLLRLAGVTVDTTDLGGAARTYEKP